MVDEVSPFACQGTWNLNNLATTENCSTLNIDDNLYATINLRLHHCVKIAIQVDNDTVSLVMSISSIT